MNTARWTTPLPTPRQAPRDTPPQATRRTVPPTTLHCTPPSSLRTVPRALPAAAGRAVPRHHPWTVALHWSSALAFVVAVVAMLWREAIEDSGLRVLLMDLHRQAGLFVLLAQPLRLAVRAWFGMAGPRPPLPPRLRRAAQVAHAAIYCLLLALPLLGVLATQAHAIELRLFGGLHLPVLVAADAELADALGDGHAMLAWALLALVAAHVVAALWHHFVRRDSVLRAMLPAPRQREPRRGRQAFSPRPERVTPPT